MKMISAKFIPVAALALVSCASLPTTQGDPIPKAIQAAQNGAFETPGPLDAVDFIGAENMQTDLYTIAPKAYNDGYINTYEIITKDHDYYVQGTAKALETLREIKATKILKGTPTVVAAGKSFAERTVNLVETPIRIMNGGFGRLEEARTNRQKVMAVSSGVGDIFSNMAHGLGQLAVTGKRIVTSASGTKCANFGDCAGKAGRDVWSGFNSVVGKHNAARRLHIRLGTDPYTDNKVLQREIDRLAMAESYTGTTYKIGVGNAGIPVWSDWTRGVGYVNNAEFVASYEDAHKRRRAEKKLLTSWGVDKNSIETLYRNPAFTHTTRTRLVQTLSHISFPEYRVKLVKDAANTPTRAAAYSRLQVLAYLAKLERDGQTQGYVTNFTSTIAFSDDGALILPFSVDYMKWTPEMANLVENYAAFSKSHPDYKRAEIHILGQASPTFLKQSKAQGIVVKIIDLS